MRPLILRLFVGVLLMSAALVGCAPAPREGGAPAPTADVERDLTQFDVAELERMADDDDVEAIKELASRYGTGTGVEKDGAKSLALLQRAVDMDDPGAMFMMGAAYANGVGVPVDLAQAVLWYEKAAAHGNPFGQYWLGMMVGNGHGGIVANWPAAQPLFEKAALQGHSDAAFMMGWLYQTGAAGEIDYETAARWYRKAFEKVLNQKAQVNLRMMIEAGQVEWREGDPGQPPEKPATGTPSALKSAGKSG